MVNIYNDDCLNVLKSLSEHKICIVTDPPFNIGYKYNSYKDNLPEGQYYSFLKTVLTTNNNPFVVVHYPEQLYKLAITLCTPPDRVLSWVYNSNTKRQHRDIAFFGISPDFSAVKQPYKNPNDKRVKKLIESGRTGTNLYDWFFVNQVKNVSKEKTTHPCQMPLEVMKNVVGIIPKDYIIFDPFTGSGTTAVACCELGRDFIGTEIDKEYYEIAKLRISQYLQEKN